MSAIARKTKARTALVGAVLAAVLSTTGLGTAGTSTDPEITDVAGDANFINGQGLEPGHEEGPDTRPASFDNVDLRAVWFETAFTTTKVFDPETGDVVRVEYHPTALAVHIQTQAPARPLDPWNAMQYVVQATLPGCTATFVLTVNSNADTSMIRGPVGGPNCGDLGASSTHVSSVTPTFDGTVATMTFPLAYSDTGKHHSVTQYIWAGARMAQPAAYAFGSQANGVTSRLRVDETVVGHDFTIGQDVPADVDCTDDPGNPQCQA